VDRSSEVLFGLIMALTFTSTFEAATAGQADVRTMLIGALGCNVAWGLVDAVMFVVTRSVEKNRSLSRLRLLQAAAPADAARIVEEDLPEGWSALLDPGDLDRLTQRLRALPHSAAPRLDADDLRGGLAVFVLVFASTLPVAIPFLIFRDLFVAARASDAVAIVMLFLIGMSLGRHAGRRPLLVGLTMVGIGVLLSAAAIRLGG
jgi:hypothetical protein